MITEELHLAMHSIYLKLKIDITYNNTSLCILPDELLPELLVIYRHDCDYYYLWRLLLFQLEYDGIIVLDSLDYLSVVTDSRVVAGCHYLYLMNQV